MSKQNIMLHLQQKAHLSLEEFQRGKDTPTSKPRYAAPEISPAGEEDELSILGGKTRLVWKKETMSPIFNQRSPISQAPVLPLPLSPRPLPASLRDYLNSLPRTNGVQQEVTVYSPQQFGQHTASLGNGSFEALSPQEPTFSPADMAQSPFYSAFSGDPMSSYLPQQQHRSQPQLATDRGMMAPRPPRNNLEIDTGTRESDMGFPQYLPVYDYGLASASYVNGAMYGTTGESASGMMDTNQSLLSVQQQYNQKRRLSDSPDGNMLTTWDDFVNSMGCVGVMRH